MIDDMLRLALDLTDRDKGRPKQASMRRAISTAYYALFHALLEVFADHTVGSGAPWDVYEQVYRFPDHASLAAKLNLVNDMRVKAIASTFARLHQERLKADYDPKPFLLGKIEVQESIILAKEAIVAVRDLNTAQRRLIVAGLLSKRR
jgi:hypothetical protein